MSSLLRLLPAEIFDHILTFLDTQSLQAICSTDKMAHASQEKTLRYYWMRYLQVKNMSVRHTGFYYDIDFNNPYYYAHEPEWHPLHSHQCDWLATPLCFGFHLWQQKVWTGAADNIYDELAISAANKVFSDNPGPRVDPLRHYDERVAGFDLNASTEPFDPRVNWVEKFYNRVHMVKQVYGSIKSIMSFPANAFCFTACECDNKNPLDLDSYTPGNRSFVVREEDPSRMPVDGDNGDNDNGDDDDDDDDLYADEELSINISKLFSDIRFGDFWIAFVQAVDGCYYSQYPPQCCSDWVAIKHLRHRLGDIELHRAIIDEAFTQILHARAQWLDIDTRYSPDAKVPSYAAPMKIIFCALNKFSRDQLELFRNAIRTVDAESFYTYTVQNAADTLRSVAIGNTWDEIAVNIDHWVYHFQTPSVSSVLDYESSDADEGYFDRWKWLEFNSKALEDEDIDEEASAESWSISADYGLSDAEEGEDAYDIELDLKRMARRSAVAFASRSTFAAIKQELRNFVKDVLTDVVMLREEAYDPETTPVHNAFVVTESDILKCVAVGNPATHRQPMIIYRGTNASSTNGVGVHFSDDEISDEELSSTSDDEVDSDDIVLETADLAVSSTNDDELEDAEDNILSDELVSDSDRDDDQKDDTQVDLVRKALVRGVKRGYAEISEPLPDRAADIGWPLNPKNGFPEGCTRQTQKSYFEYESEENESYSDDPEDAWQDDVFDALCDRYDHRDRGDFYMDALYKYELRYYHPELASSGNEPDLSIDTRVSDYRRNGLDIAVKAGVNEEFEPKTKLLKSIRENVCDEISYLTQCERWQEAINRVGEHFTDAFEQPGRHPEFTRRLSLLANNDIPPKSATFCLDFLLPTDANIYTGAICSALAKNSSLTKVTFLMFPRQMRSEESSALMHVILTKTRISSATFRDFDISREALHAICDAVVASKPIITRTVQLRFELLSCTDKNGAVPNAVSYLQNLFVAANVRLFQSLGAYVPLFG